MKKGGPFMKKRTSIRGFVTGALTMALVFALASPAGAQMVGKTIEVFTGITIYVNGAEMKPTDANGNPVDVFVYEGTTYVPLRAVSQSLGENVQYDGPTQSVYIGDDPRMTNYLLTVCPPYESSGYRAKAFSMDGISYPANGFYLDSSPKDYALFNLNGQYSSLTVTMGHLNGHSQYESGICIYLDGQLSQTITLEKECLAKQITIPLNGALQLKIARNQEKSSGGVGFANAILH